jgi:hypothetical protein
MQLPRVEGRAFLAKPLRDLSPLNTRSEGVAGRKGKNERRLNVCPAIRDKLIFLCKVKYKAHRITTRLPFGLQKPALLNSEISRRSIGGV